MLLSLPYVFLECELSVLYYCVLVHNVSVHKFCIKWIQNVLVTVQFWSCTKATLHKKSRFIAFLSLNSGIPPSNRLTNITSVNELIIGANLKNQYPLTPASFDQIFYECFLLLVLYIYCTCCNYLAHVELKLIVRVIFLKATWIVKCSALLQSNGECEVTINKECAWDVDLRCFVQMVPAPSFVIICREASQLECQQKARHHCAGNHRPHALATQRQRNGRLWHRVADDWWMAIEGKSVCCLRAQKARSVNLHLWNSAPIAQFNSLNIPWQHWMLKVNVGIRVREVNVNINTTRIVWFWVPTKYSIAKNTRHPNLYAATKFYLAL